MNQKSSERSPLARLVLFMICLSVAGSCFAGLHYAVVDRPAQLLALHPPANSGDPEFSTMDFTFWDWLFGPVNGKNCYIRIDSAGNWHLACDP
ncbi:MAG: hypothetical protein ACYDDV_07030 [Methanoregula sp.]